jgi:hypothetical protein
LAVAALSRDCRIDALICGYQLNQPTWFSASAQVAGRRLDFGDGVAMTTPPAAVTRAVPAPEQ